MSEVLDPPLAHPALQTAARLAAAAGELTADLWALSDRELLAFRASLERISARIASARLTATGEISVRGSAASVEREGFALAHNINEPGMAWFNSTKTEKHIASREGWWVIVDIPDDVAERWRSTFPDGTVYLDNFHIPWDVVNAHRPFTYERQGVTRPKSSR